MIDEALVDLVRFLITFDMIRPRYDKGYEDARLRGDGAAIYCGNVLLSTSLSAGFDRSQASTITINAPKSFLAFYYELV